ncbi:uncharacterized protein LOC144159119 [Haemaphysalis longicornis]|uniref:Uncharacterized protein n=1 Tax=Haemaphysalis longicornis TaxID=44386 RepID=A0A9J6FFP1_HAELO|nr:hypothetical protein HPB48_001551 [Haemaphysalis longicornis]
MEPIFASDDMHANGHGEGFHQPASDPTHSAAPANVSSWGTVLAVNASRARKLARRDDLAAAKVVGIWLGCFFIIFLVVGIPNYIQKRMRTAQGNGERTPSLERQLSLDEIQDSG